MSKKSKPSKSIKKVQPIQSKAAPKGKRPSESAKIDPKAATSASGSKLSHVIALLSRPEGVTLDEIVKATEWQKHTVRGLMSGSLKKKHGYTITSTKKDGELRVYKIDGGKK